MELSGTEILIRAFANHHIDTIFTYPGACVISILDKLYDHKEIRQILVRHEQGAIHAACGYAQLSDKPGVAIVTSGPGATNTLTGIADAFYSQVPLIIITGQVLSELIGTDAFQEIDMISVTAPVTNWSCQIRNAGEVASVVEKIFTIATETCPGPVLLDITKDAQTGIIEYLPHNIKPNPDGSTAVYCTLPCKFPENRFYSELLKSLEDSGKDIVLVIDKLPNDFYTEERFGYNRVIKSDVYGVPGFGLPAAIGAKCAAPDKTICLIAGTLEFQATFKELGVIKQHGLDIKIVLLDEATTGMYEIKNPDFVQLTSAYEITADKIDSTENIPDAIGKMLTSADSYLLQIIT